jgi:hypothetical protein
VLRAPSLCPCVDLCSVSVVYLNAQFSSDVIAWVVIHRESRKKHLFKNVCGVILTSLSRYSETQTQRRI